MTSRAPRQTARRGRELENVRRLLVAVSSRAHDIDVELSELAADVKAIGAATVERLERDATGLEHWLRESVVDSLPAAERRGDAAAVNAALRAGHGALLRAFVGLEDGSFVQYPAREVSASWT